MIELTKEQELEISYKALDFVTENISMDGIQNWNLIFDMKRELLKKDLIIEHLKTQVK